MKLKKFLLPLLVTPLFLASCGVENVPEAKANGLDLSENTTEGMPEAPVIFNYVDSEGNNWSVNTETREITKNGVLYFKYEVFSDTLWYSMKTLFHVKEDGILIENIYKEGEITVLTLIPEEEPATNAEGK